MNGKTGHRSATPNSLRGELLARSFKGLPDGMSYHQALKIVRRHINGTSDLSRRAKLLMLALLQIQAIAVLNCDGEGGLDLGAFTAFPRNDTLEGMLAMSRRTVQKAIAELRDALLVWCNDAPDRNRSRFFGINLLPAFARVEEFSAAEVDRATNRSIARNVQRQFTGLKIELEALRQMLGSQSVNELEGLIRQCDLWRRSRDIEAGMRQLLELRAAVDVLKAAAVCAVTKDKDESPQDVISDTPLTYKTRPISKDVDAVPPQESGAGSISGCGDRVRLPVLGPHAEDLIPAIEAAFRSKGLPIYDVDRTATSNLLRLYGRASAATIRLSRRVVDELEEKFGVSGASHILIQAACDPAVRNRPGWARSFVHPSFSAGVVDTRRSFHRWRANLLAEAT
ncbi:helix-turn-helix domain-containing protein [Asticcacaulis sp. W401b]|uniref:helix-turn-helix domain-containing protein n=1 Tax=Asticcacaulis sp. W401b TaxID=3388666 RepID=UPI003970D33F